MEVPQCCQTMLERGRSCGLMFRALPSSRSWECFPPLSKAGAASWLAASLLPWEHSLPLPLLFPRQRSLQSAQSDGSCCSKSTSPALMWSGISGSHRAQAEPGGLAQTQGRSGAVARASTLLQQAPQCSQNKLTVGPLSGKQRYSYGQRSRLQILRQS